MLTVPRPRRPSLRARESDVLFTRTPDVLEMVRLDRIPTPLYFSPEIFLAVLSHISVLSSKKVMYHFVLGLTAKLVGTEVGIIEPITSFSSCFGATFMPHKMNVYAELLIRNGGLCGFAFAFAQENNPFVPRDVIRALQQRELATCRVAEWAFIRAESSTARTWAADSKG